MTTLADLPTRALSVVQPWAWGICNAGKGVENRERWPYGCTFRGPIFIHASMWPTTGRVTAPSVIELGMTARDVASIARQNGVQMPGSLTLSDLFGQRGGIVGRARVVGEVYRHIDGRGAVYETPGGPLHATMTRFLTEQEERWWQGGFALLLAEQKPLPFVKCKGALGLWTVPEAVRRAVGEAIQ